MTDSAGSALVPAEVADTLWLLYEQRKAAFLAAHPHATPDEIETHCRLLTEQEGL